MRQAIQFGYMACFVGLAAVSGCGEAPPKLPDTVPVTGKVSLDGSPLAGASLTFISTAEKKGLNATGITNESGAYELSIGVGKVEKKGAVIGKYKVRISRFLDPKGNPQDPSKPVEFPGRESLPEKYSSPNQTVLTATIEAGGGSSKDFELKSK